MALTECAECGKGISAAAVMCPHCGAPPEVALGRPSEDGNWLEQAARVSLHQSEGDVDWLRVESIKHEGAEIANLRGVVDELRRLPKLKWLSLSRNAIEDARPLAELAGLRYLFLEQNRIADPAPLCELKELKQLWLYNNPLQNEDIIMVEQALPKCEVFF
ncbi:MAG: hypothetical protein CMO64_05570 [Verrucomicrobiales bacterium]|nr:hypothetical protein [Verrucomicrobiales bacterium]|tara:strand:- start:235 stop:717 length:483 start_codon:yes stop_codon:yes gene_type:complete